MDLQQRKHSTQAYIAAMQLTRLREERGGELSPNETQTLRDALAVVDAMQPLDVLEAALLLQGSRLYA